MDWLGNNVKTFKVKGITIIANRNNGMVIGLDREGEEVVDLLKSNLIEISSLSGVRTKIWTPIGLSKGAFLCIHMRKSLLH